jgi:formate dehydrogenase accessory protein FdhD
MGEAPSRSGRDGASRAHVTDRVAPGVVYTTFHHPDTQANVVTTDYSDWATNCPEYKVTAVQVALSNGPTEWQEEYAREAAAARRILPAAESMWLAPARADALAERRRHMAGPVGCGLCGLDSLEAALRPAARLTAAGPRLARHDITAALAALRETQALHDTTRAVHAAGLYTPGRGLLAAREDVGRHNALDKLAGAAARRELDTSQSAVVLTSRVSVDLVQKTARLGAPVLIAVSAPTAHAVRLADEAGLTLIASARDDGFEVYTHPNRLDPGAAVHVA